MHRLVALALIVSTVSAQDNWPQFLGAGSTATANGADTLRFDREKDLRYRVAIPAGASSPCIWESQIFLTGLDGKELVMFALDRDTGKERWRHTVPAPKGIEFKHQDGGVAMPTACTNGERVFFYLPSYGLIVRDLDGELVWEKKLPRPKTDFGIGTSPTLCGDNVILLRDGCPDAKLYAFDAKTGKEAWAVSRVRFYESHTTPFVWRNAQRTELIVASTGTVMSFEPKTGEVLWRVEGLTPLVCTTPTASPERLFFAGWSTMSAAAIDRFLDGMENPIELTDAERKDPARLFQRFDEDSDGKLTKAEAPPGRIRAAWKFFDRDGNDVITRPEWDPMMRIPQMGKNVMIAIKAGGEGNITKTHVEWSAKRGIPYVSSPLLHQGKLILVKAGGVIGGFDAASGKQVIRRRRLADHSEYYATPIGVGDFVIACSSAGTLFVLDPKAKLKTVRSIEFEEPIFATPAVVDGVVFVRTRAALYAFGKKP
jgi:outer membrane protein assembly factor BamB